MKEYVIVSSEYENNLLYKDAPPKGFIERQLINIITNHMLENKESIPISFSETTVGYPNEGIIQRSKCEVIIIDADRLKELLNCERYLVDMRNGYKLT